MSHMKTKTLRKNCKKLLIDKGLDQPGRLSVLAEAIGANKNSISMALSGFRDGPVSIELLNRIILHVKALPSI